MAGSHPYNLWKLCRLSNDPGILHRLWQWRRLRIQYVVAKSLAECVGVTEKLWSGFVNSVQWNCRECDFSFRSIHENHLSVVADDCHSLKKEIWGEEGLLWDEVTVKGDQEDRRRTNISSFSFQEPVTYALSFLTSISTVTFNLYTYSWATLQVEIQVDSGALLFVVRDECLCQGSQRRRNHSLTRQ